MTFLTVSTAVFLCVFCSALLGMFLAPKLPVSHQDSDSKEIVRLTMGLVSTTVAVALGLLISSAKSFYDAQNTEITRLAANFILLDQILESYGPETATVRSVLRDHLSSLVDHEMQGTSPSAETYTNIKSGTRFGRDVLPKIQELSPKDEVQRSAKAQAVNYLTQIAQTRWLIFEQSTVPVPKLLIYMMIGWLIALFLSFGIFAPRNFMVIAGFFIAALVVSGAILLILELYHPEAGLIRVSGDPLRAALAQLRQ
jgi:hypothetical protein